MTYSRLDHSQASDSAHGSPTAPPRIWHSQCESVQSHAGLDRPRFLSSSHILTLVLVASLNRSTASSSEPPEGSIRVCCIPYGPPITKHTARGVSTFSWYSDGAIWNVVRCFNTGEPGPIRHTNRPITPFFVVIDVEAPSHIAFGGF